MNEKNFTKKEKSKKDISTKASSMATVRIIHQKKGRQHLFYLWTKVRGKWFSCGTFYPKVGWRDWSIFPRAEREMSMLQLQYKFGRQSIYFWAEVGDGKSSRTLQNKTTDKQILHRGLPIKNRTLYKIK